jgi:very-short-patch-repair endonuclease
VDDAALLTLAATQHGLVGDAQAVKLGFSASMIRRRIRSGEWSRPLPRVLRCVGAPDSGRQAAMAAAIWAGPEAVVSHATAGVLWGLDGITTRRVHVTIPLCHNLRSPLVTVHRTSTFDPSEHTLIHDIPVTGVTRTLIDVAGSLPRDALELAIEDAFRRRLTSPDQLRRRFVELAGNGRSGSGVLRELLDSRGDAAPTGSALEVELERLLVRGGLPRPVRQHAITHSGRTIHVDLAYPDRRLAIELDSLRWHTGRAKLDNDAERRNLLHSADWALVTVTHTMVKQRARATVATVAAAYADRAHLRCTGTATGWPENANEGEGGAIGRR